MKKLKTILAILLIVIITTAVIAYTTLGLNMYSAYEIITGIFALLILMLIKSGALSATSSLVVVGLIFAFIFLIVSTYILKKMFKKNIYVFFNLVLITITGGLGWIIVIIMYLLIKYKYIDPDAEVNQSYNVGNNDNIDTRTDAQKYYIDKLMKPENFDCMGNRKFGKW